MRLIGLCTTQLKAQRPSRTCYESEEEEEEEQRELLPRATQQALMFRGGLTRYPVAWLRNVSLPPVSYERDTPVQLFLMSQVPLYQEPKFRANGSTDPRENLALQNIQVLSPKPAPQHGSACSQALQAVTSSQTYCLHRCLNPKPSTIDPLCRCRAERGHLK